MQHKCWYCNTVFRGQASAKYCSDKCRMAAHRDKKRRLPLWPKDTIKINGLDYRR